MKLRNYALWAILMACAPAYSEVGTTGKPTNWVQIGETKDTLVQLDANSILGFKTGRDTLAHRADFRYKGKLDDRLTSKPLTAFMMQEDCEKTKGNISILPIGPDGQPNGNGDTYDFDLNENRVHDAVAKTMCKARKIMLDNQRLVQGSADGESTERQPTIERGSAIVGRNAASKKITKKFEPRLELRFAQSGEVAGDVVIATPKGQKYRSCDGSISDDFREYLFQAISSAARASGVKEPSPRICTVIGLKFEKNIFFKVDFWRSMEKLKECAQANVCEFNSVMSRFTDSDAMLLTLTATDASIRKQGMACLNLRSGTQSVGLCPP